MSMQKIAYNYDLLQNWSNNCVLNFIFAKDVLRIQKSQIFPSGWARVYAEMVGVPRRGGDSTSEEQTILKLHDQSGTRYPQSSPVKKLKPPEGG